jgi:DNA-binding response OmpR family regulator
MKKKNILIVDDEAKLRRVIREYLVQEGYFVSEAENGEQALYAARHQNPDLIILDIMMPVMNGLDFLRIYRKESETPIIFLTAKIEDHDEVLGLEIGADDFVRKPFSMKALMARVRAVLRRHEQPRDGSAELELGLLRLSPAARLSFVGPTKLPLTPTEFGILHTLMATPGRAFSRSELLEASTGQAFEAYERSVDVHVRNLRKKIKQGGLSNDPIETVFGIGYRLNLEIASEAQ